MAAFDNCRSEPPAQAARADGPAAAVHGNCAELNRLHDRGEFQVLVVNNGEPEATREWAAEAHARFPVLAGEFQPLKRHGFVTCSHS
jgi:hypothetical protein